jgi:fused signal recognition particle receptor
VELFEILFILFFILIPILEGIRKSRQRGRDAEQGPVPQPRPSHPPGLEHARDRAQPPDSRPQPEPADASDMIPDDLWEILTGERRPRGPGPARPEPEPEPDEPEIVWRAEPSWSPELEEPDFGQFSREEPPEPAPLSIPTPPLPTPQQEVQPTGFTDHVPAPSTSARRWIRDAVDAPPQPIEPSPLVKALHEPDTLRQAVILSEILGRPKGLD